MSSFTYFMKRLEDTAMELNQASDQMGAAIKALEIHLAGFNLGVEAWFQIPHSTIYLGYAKIVHWGLAIKQDDNQWLFNDAPRKHRLDYIPFITDLIREMQIQGNIVLEKTKASVLDISRLISFDNKNNHTKENENAQQSVSKGGDSDIATTR